MYKYFKAGLDFISALTGLIILSPFIVFMAVVLAIVNKGNPFFRQSRPGRNGKTFHIIKFKTMHDKIDKDGKLLPDSQRLHWIGRLIRKASIDELPQLINVLKGDMSLVGPRPLLAEYLLQHNEEHQKRHDVRPGITGWAQVNGRNAINREQKIEFDLWYVENLSFLLDLKILWLTLLKVFSFEGVYRDDILE
jgi:lipopolysaccharide/colanic/teichoic acid biosynthesis glycosyltransferase